MLDSDKKIERQAFQVNTNKKSPLNIINTKLKICSLDPITGWTRNGTCFSDSSDRGNHSVCAQVTTEFLEYTKARGNDLSTPNPRYGFKGLKDGDRWCLCAARVKEAKEAGINLKIDKEATHPRALEVFPNFTGVF